MGEPNMSAALGYILTDAAIRVVWCGPGIRPIESADVLRVPRWEDRRAAERAARALRLGGFNGLRATAIHPPR